MGTDEIFSLDEQTIRTYKIGISALNTIAAKEPGELRHYRTIAHFQALVIEALENQIRELRERYENVQSNTR